jgi:polyhydroxyalkanoate synthase subunit PhaC
MAERSDKADDAGQAYVVQDPEKLATNMMHFFSQGARALTRYMDDKRQDGPYAMATELSEAGKLLGVITQHWMTEPQKLAQRQTQLTEDLVELWGRTYRRFLGEEVEPVARPEKNDARFQDPEWNDNPFFDFCKQAYLITTSWADDFVREAEGVDDATRRRAQFYLNQITSALSPSNFPMTNPEVLRATLSTNGENLLQGMTQLVKDLDESKDLLRIRQTDLSAFAIGKNLAVTPGKVVFQNDIMQLIQYTPTTEQVFAVPLLIVPPWINKFYILDLVPQKSFIRWLVDQGITVFVVSWVNPDEKLARKTFEDYMHEGILAPLEAVQKITEAPKVNTLGYCVGGTLLGTTLAYLAAKGDERINAASFLAAQVDFTEAGDLLVFIEETQLKALEGLMVERGYLDGSRMAAVFNMLRPKDLIWPYIVNNYLLGKQPFPFDLLYWNSDTTRMPPANHSFYLREFYKANRLARGEMEIAGVKLDLSKVMQPIYELATREDHIAPARSVFTGAKLFGGPVRFVLAGSGHIAGVVNPPERQKYMFWAPPEGTDAKAVPSLEDWIASAQQAAGSWWPDYAKWLKDLSGEQVPARIPGKGPLPALEDAPGSYVRR